MTRLLYNEEIPEEYFPMMGTDANEFYLDKNDNILYICCGCFKCDGSEKYWIVVNLTTKLTLPMTKQQLKTTLIKKVDRKINLTLVP